MKRHTIRKCMCRGWGGGGWEGGRGEQSVCQSQKEGGSCFHCYDKGSYHPLLCHICLKSAIWEQGARTGAPEVVTWLHNTAGHCPHTHLQQAVQNDGCHWPLVIIQLKQHFATVLPAKNNALLCASTKWPRSKSCIAPNPFQIYCKQTSHSQYISFKTAVWPFLAWCGTSP